MTLNCHKCCCDDIMFCECNSEYTHKQSKTTIPVQVPVPHKRPSSPPIPIPHENDVSHDPPNFDTKMHVRLLLHVKALESRVMVLEQLLQSKSNSTLLKIVHKRSHSW
jgi:hypothetical protein